MSRRISILLITFLLLAFVSCSDFMIQNDDVVDINQDVALRSVGDGWISLQIRRYQTVNYSFEVQEGAVYEIAWTDYNGYLTTRPKVELDVTIQGNIYFNTTLDGDTDPDSVQFTADSSGTMTISFENITRYRDNFEVKIELLSAPEQPEPEDPLEPIVGSGWLTRSIDANGLFEQELSVVQGAVYRLAWTDYYGYIDTRPDPALDVTVYGQTYFNTTEDGDSTPDPVEFTADKTGVILIEFIEVDGYGGAFEFRVDLLSDDGGDSDPEPEDPADSEGVIEEELDPGPVPHHRHGVKVYALGNEEWVTTQSSGGTMLMGGGYDDDNALLWMIGKSGGGDFVVLRADDSDAYNSYIYNDLGGVDSVHTLVVSSREGANTDYVYQVLKNAEAVFIAGGDQTSYYDFYKGTKVEEALNYLVNVKNVPIGGTSAGMAVLGELSYIPSSSGIISSEALSDPYHAFMNNIRNDFLSMPYLANTLTDTHWSERDRLGRTITMMARIIQDGLGAYGNVRAIAADECAAVAISADGTATIFGTNRFDDYVYFMSANSSPDICASGTPLHWTNAVTVYKVKGTEDGANSFNLNTWTGSGGTIESVNVIHGVIDNNIQTPN